MKKDLKLRIPLLTIFLFILHGAFAQQKIEREYRLDISEVPTHAIQFIDISELENHVKWYFEENLKGNSIEAKFTYKSKRYSIEFDTTGKLQDIEIEIPSEDMDTATLSIIELNLSARFSKYKIDKIQIQYSDSLSSFSEFLKTINDISDRFIKYEIVAKGKREKRWKLYEFTYSRQGSLESEVQIILRNTDNLEY